MSTKIFINLPVADLGKATAFYERLGATKDAQFSNDTSGNCLVFSDTIHVMLLTHAFFSTFTSKPVADARVSCQVLLCISRDSRAAVDDIVTQAANGGMIDPSPKQDHDFMYGRSFEDPDGHIWEVMWMDAEAAKVAMTKGVMAENAATVAAC